MKETREALKQTKDGGGLKTALRFLYFVAKLQTKENLRDN